jgi:hypothetical protein
LASCAVSSKALAALPVSVNVADGFNLYVASLQQFSSKPAYWQVHLGEKPAPGENRLDIPNQIDL